METKSRKGAMELTMGTMVTIVLLVMVLILGGYFVNKIFFSAGTSIDNIDQLVKNEISKMFSEDNSRKIVIYPETRKISIKKGTEGNGFGLSIRNVGNEPAKFGYEIESVEIGEGCPMTLSQADSLLFGGSRSDIQIGAGDKMTDPVLIEFNIPETTPPCKIRYSITMTKGTEPYGSSVDIIITILGR